LGKVKVEERMNQSIPNSVDLLIKQLCKKRLFTVFLVFIGTVILFFAGVAMRWLAAVATNTPT